MPMAPWLSNSPTLIIEETCLNTEQWGMDICSANKEVSQVVSSGYFPLAKEPLVAGIVFWNYFGRLLGQRI